MNEQQAQEARPLTGYQVNLSIAPQPHPDGKIRHHVLLHYSNASVNLVMDLGPHDSTRALAEQLGPALLDAADTARREDSGLKVARTGEKIGPTFGNTLPGGPNRATRRANGHR